MSTPDGSEHATTDHLSNSVHESVNKIAKTAGKAEERIRHGAIDAEAHVRDAGRKAKESSSKTLQSIGGFVREHPVTSLSFAFAAGTLLYALKRRP